MPGQSKTKKQGRKKEGQGKKMNMSPFYINCILLKCEWGRISAIMYVLLVAILGTSYRGSRRTASKREAGCGWVVVFCGQKLLNWQADQAIAGSANPPDGWVGISRSRCPRWRLPYTSGRLISFWTYHPHFLHAPPPTSWDRCPRLTDLSPLGCPPLFQLYISLMFAQTKKPHSYRSNVTRRRY